MTSTPVGLADRPSPEATYLDDVLARLWPQPARVWPGRRTPCEGEHVLGDFTLLPSAAKPRMVIPRASRRAAAASVDMFGEHRSPADRLRRAAVWFALRTGIGRALGGRIRIVTDRGRPTETMSDYLSEVLGERVQLAFSVGVARANRKPVLRVMDRTGRTVAFAKIGISEFTNRLVEAESRALAAVSDLHPVTFTAPTVLHEDTWNGLRVLVQAPLPAQRRRKDADAHRRLAAMLELVGAEDTEPTVVAPSERWTRLRCLVADGADEPSMALTDALDALEPRLAGCPLTHGAWHGDWSPWNMAFTSDSLLVWDWERYERDVPRGFDALHYHLQSIKSTMSGDDAVHAVHHDAARLLAPFGIDREAASVVVVLYAVHLAVRYVADYAAMGSRTWAFEGSPMIDPLIRFITGWDG